MSRLILVLTGILTLIGIGSAYVQAQRRAMPERQTVDLHVERDRVPDARVVFRAWRFLQRQTSRSYWRVELLEQTNSSIDGPAGLMLTDTKARVYGRPDTTYWTRRLFAVHSDSTDVPRPEWWNVQKEWHAQLGPEVAALALSIEVPLPRLDSMEPVGPAEADTLNGTPYWRIEAAPEPSTSGHEYERIILWVDQEVGHLSRSVALIQTDQTSLTTITDYERINGLDLPARRTIAGTMSMQRRLRTFTQFFRLDTRYSEYRFYKRSVP